MSDEGKSDPISAFIREIPGQLSADYHTPSDDLASWCLDLTPRITYSFLNVNPARS